MWYLGVWLALAGALAAPPPNDFRFSILGDRTGGAVPGIYERIWEEVNALHPAFVINVGDTIQGHDDARAAGEWAALRRIWKRYPYPLFFTPGNHDIWNERSRRLYEKETGRPCPYSFDWGRAHFTVLDNSQAMELAPDQLDFLERDLRAHHDAAPKFVFFHQPFWLVTLALGSGDFRLHRLAVRYGVMYVIAGHAHRLIRMERDGVTYLVMGSSGASTDTGFYHHVVATVKGAKASLSVKELGGRMTPLEQWPEATKTAAR